MRADALMHPWDEEALKVIVAEVASLRDEVLDLRQGFGAAKVANVPRVILPELHDENTGRIDARKVAEFMGVPLKPLAEGLGLNYKAVHRNPSAGGFQEALRPVKRSLEILHEFFGPKETIRIWLNTPHPDLDGTTSLETILRARRLPYQSSSRMRGMDCRADAAAARARAAALPDLNWSAVHGPWWRTIGVASFAQDAGGTAVGRGVENRGRAVYAEGKFRFALPFAGIR